MVVGGSQQETVHPCFVLFGTRQQGAPVILRELVLLNLFDPMSPNYTISLSITTQTSVNIQIKEISRRSTHDAHIATQSDPIQQLISTRASRNQVVNSVNLG
ncbi:unnamed protein product [Schistosoma curassoni]|uniref:Uncharacterized protein n=1 Tax=Schistosoma curassoni TaxID=6186 RepID=A0A183JMD3_9TREM|nr:unnamed protein product [Schistosoma curassoni]